ncbi:MULTISPECIES: ergothioneine biosynthesis glutamate--cysteine ligase EgtA [unclassified Mycolicibacterium]|uniref:ergothioneine biosynthesis glutamate--cysteine ligase EgtA n=1 Tax=unclassified Mycolicibacterium TaxID=2636767 RepID=UPI0012DCDDE2|nr:MULTISPECIES: ergothioneine biosynthesis glutamate--cysteine ligase EgtA [unclassified Mycolicibacterium]MUL84232.1 ergothioneine biosynthesis glutamate--cysteine ligase EgtA [Mycolicibacterium sp. CBMA 329]MUL89702.1 ergothioneine biosynthesis glutamate--cysteine ligase EgtA [Mycolicibacterium sp. CBMA 331]MUM39217.1 ergothioneine biosynthesis glutamate--cysteine ligase EgtA [Mycolicibacterium sp. CBMA 247]MUM46303.1 ergothioneine biosynthesis glutamate--cysteine ligase EgtA [Mycolicibacter
MAVPVRAVPARLPAVEFTSAEQAAAFIGANCLHDGPVGQVGLEIEAHCFDLDDPLRRPGWDELSQVIASVPALPGGSRITVEPGGAVELSGPPADGPSAAIAALQVDRSVLRAEFERHGLGLVLLGADPVRPTQRVNPGPRYQAMEQFFAASGSAEPGAAMMTSTASVQVNLDAGPRDDWAQRVRLAHALGPTMIAITANSPMLGGQFTGWKSSRQRVWGQLDSARCGPVLGADGDDPASDWARYALRAPVMLVNTAEETRAVPVINWVPFADWADGRAVLGGRRPTDADLEYHLTTLFPPVRPRRWLEIRYLDSVPDALWPAVVFTLTTLLDDPEAAAIAAEATAPVATAWDRAARIGLADRRLQESAIACVSAAAQRAPAELAESMGQLTRSVQEGRCPADDFADQVVGLGITSAVSQLVKGEL